MRERDGKITKELAKKLYDSKDEKDGLATRQAIGAILNVYEIIAISIYFGDADEYLLREYYNGLILGHFESLFPMIEEWRKTDPETFVYFEWLAKRWRDNPEI